MRNFAMARAALLLSVSLSALSGTVMADDIGFKRFVKNCPVPELIGAQAFTSRVITRTENNLPPSAEMRRPADEIILLQSHDQVADEATQENIAPFASGQHILTADEQKQLNAMITRMTGKKLERVEIIGHADQQTLTPAALRRYGNNNGLSAARTQEVATFLRTTSGWQTVPMTRRWVGASKPVIACDAGHPGDSAVQMTAYQECLGANRRVEIQVWFAPPAASTDHCATRTKTQAAMPFRISVDGMPLDAADAPNSADVTRCTDLALEKSDIQVRYDALESTPVLNITAWPDAAVRGKPVAFAPYSNYLAYIDHAEVRIIASDASEQKEPLAIIAVNKDFAENPVWDVPLQTHNEDVRYILRVYDHNGRFDETEPKLLRLLETDKVHADTDTPAREALVGYGENHRSIKNIAISGGSVTINGQALQPQTKVWAMGQLVPVDPEGKFAFRQIVAAGDHQVSVVTEAPDGARAEFNRTLYVPDNDWFYIALGDLTVGANNVKGPARLVAADDNGKQYREGAYADGRMAFYVKGKIKGDYLLTASGDTQEQPVEDMFTNFSAKDPRYLLRRLDPNAYYPVYGDDSTTVEDAPTRGKFYVKLARGDSNVMWGNFQTKINGTDLLNYSRSLYGANAEYKSEAATQFGERRTEVQGFVADPGTLGALEEFRGTGGSLYYLRGQDVMVGSERVRVEVRDRDSGIVLQTKELVSGQDFEINYIQGRIILRTPLSSTADGSTLINVGTSSGNPAYLVVGYEYAPTVAEISNWTKGGHASQWLNDYLKLGVTGYQQKGAGTDQDLVGADATMRYAPGTYAKMEVGRSQGAGSGAMASNNGGFNFSTLPQTNTPNIAAMAYRAETGIDFAEILAGATGKLDAYYLRRENGYSAPGQLTNEGVTQVGLNARMPINDRLDFEAKADIKEAQTTGSTKAAEMIGNYKVTPENTVSVAVRHDDRETSLAAGSSDILAETGSRTDAALKVLHAPLDELGAKKDYEVYGLAQATLARDANRDANNRFGAGGRYALNDRVTLTGEATDGNGGWGGKAGAEYRVSDRTSYYTNYQVDTERTDTGYRGRNTNMAVGGKSRYTDSTSVFAEQRQQTFDNGPSGLIHAFGLDYAPNDRWTWGGRFEHGTIADAASGDLQRTALSLSAGYHLKDLKYAGNAEWRDEQGNVLGQRTSWLMRNNLAYQTTPDWRFLGSFNFALSESGLGSNLNANFTEVKLGYAYRPVDNDRLNALAKYTYLDDQGSPGQVAADNTTSVIGFAQRSHVIDLDAIYDLTPKLAVGGKFGYRIGEVKDNNVINPQWFSSQAYLAIARVDYHVVYEWDLTGEYRYLAVQEAQDAKIGALIGIYRHINENFKLGAGYNFTNFSDDLTDMSYRSHGYFINALAKF
jgi:outer membrane protein OmpA-like peptidoglycan-associated protein